MNYASVCDGIGAVHVAWQPLGWTCEWTAEIDAFPSAVVEQRWGFPNRGDMTKFNEWSDDGSSIDLLVGGTPCQSFSVAGLRKGLHDPRGGLMLTFLEIAQRHQPRWLVWENVPGVLSSNGGRDFGSFLGALGSLGYGWAYRVLDAQWFGVAQRRRRVFVVGCLGDERRAAQVLFESESVRRDNPPSRAKGQGVAVATPISTRTGRSDDRGDGGDNIVAFHPTQDPISRDDGLTHCRGSGSSRGCATAAVAFKPSYFTRGKDGKPSEVTPLLSADADKGDQDTVIAPSASQGGMVVAYDVLGTPATNAAKETDVHVPLRARMPGQSEASTTTVVPQPAIGFDGFQSDNPKATHQATIEGTGPLIRGRPHCVATAMAVRRLTPRECERLQGFPDDYTAIAYRKKPAADGPRYKALGNSMAVPVMRWIGERIDAIDKGAK